jgi:hypothetical protein
MRKLGYLLVIAGFTWLVFLQAVQSLCGGVRPILRTEYIKVDKGGRSTIPIGEVIELIRDTAVQCFNSQPLFLLPGVVMLVGTILIGRRSSIT